MQQRLLVAAATGKRWLHYFFKDHYSLLRGALLAIRDDLSVSATRIRRQRAKNLASTPTAGQAHNAIFLASLGPQRDHRVHLRRPPSRNPAGRHSDRQQRQRQDRESHWIS